MRGDDLSALRLPLCHTLNYLPFSPLFVWLQLRFLPSAATCLAVAVNVAPAYVLYVGSNMISDGSELLLLIPWLAGIVGSCVLPVLGCGTRLRLHPRRLGLVRSFDAWQDANKGRVHKSFVAPDGQSLCFFGS